MVDSTCQCQNLFIEKLFKSLYSLLGVYDFEKLNKYIHTKREIL